MTDSPAQKLYECLLSKNIVGSPGKIFFEIQNFRCQINDNSIIGNVIQAWLQSFMEANSIHYKTVSNTQEFPDFYLDDSSDNRNLLEVKCFTKSANFDIANFLSYCTSIAEKPYRLNADYLIFEYKNVKNEIVISRIWLKKVWQISGASDRSKIKAQWKKGQIYNIRPSNWYGKGKIQYPPFQSRLEFVTALQEVLNTHPSADTLRKDFLKNVSSLFKQQTGEDL
jgi:hypothetical protein